MVNGVFFQLAAVLGLSLAFGYVINRLKLPLVIAYLLAGVVLSFIALFDSRSVVFEIFPEIAIAFLLFLIGMELDLREIKSLGRPIIFASLGQIIASLFTGYGLASLLGFGHQESIYIGLGLSFSSTVLVIKLLLEKRDLASLNGKLSIGILLIEDLVAIIALMLISVGNSVLDLGLQQLLSIITLLLKAVGLFVLTFFISRYLLERIFAISARSSELLFLTAISWCFIFTAVALSLGFSVVIGAFLAGVALASSSYHLEIQGRIKPLRDFFVVLFFVYLGTQAQIAHLIALWPIVLIFTAYAVIIKPLLYLVLLSLFGFRKHTLFTTSLNLSQISEFSLVLALVGSQAGHVSKEVLSVMAGVAVASMILSSLLIAYAPKIYQSLSHILGIFELRSKKHTTELGMDTEEEITGHVIVIGAHRFGGPIVEYLHKKKVPLIVMDFNPHVVEELRELGIKVVYGDLSDTEMLENLGLSKAKLIISTANDVFDNQLLIKACKARKVKATIVVRAQDEYEAEMLKKLGADFVVVPESLSGNIIVEELAKSWPKIQVKSLD